MTRDEATAKVLYVLETHYPEDGDRQLASVIVDALKIEETRRLVEAVKRVIDMAWVDESGRSAALCIYANEMCQLEDALDDWEKK